jgi:hypothetical protein
MPKTEALTTPWEIRERPKKAETVFSYRNPSQLVTSTHGETGPHFTLFSVHFALCALCTLCSALYAHAVAKQQRLMQLFLPPFEIIFKGNFEQLKQHGRLKNKWCLVNMQDTQNFDCQRLNRDTWKDGDVKQLVQENFVFIQLFSDQIDGKEFMSLYSIFELPSICVIDSTTGELMLQLAGFIDAQALYLKCKLLALCALFSC